MAKRIADVKGRRRLGQPGATKGPAFASSSRRSTAVRFACILEPRLGRHAKLLWQPRRHRTEVLVIASTAQAASLVARRARKSCGRGHSRTPRGGRVPILCHRPAGDHPRDSPTRSLRVIPSASLASPKRWTLPRSRGRGAAVDLLGITPSAAAFPHGLFLSSRSCGQAPAEQLHLRSSSMRPTTCCRLRWMQLRPRSRASPTASSSSQCIRDRWRSSVLRHPLLIAVA